MASLDSLAGLIVATMELQAVRAVTQAINANLPKDGPLGTIRPSSAQLTARPKLHYNQTPEARIVQRPVVHPTPNFATGPTGYDSKGNACGYAAESKTLAVSTACDAWTMDEPRKLSAHVFDAPWKHLPPISHPEVQVKVNLVRPQVELITKGMLLDLFA